MTNFVFALLQLGIVLFGRYSMARWVARLKKDWQTYEDRQFLLLCDEEYELLSKQWSPYQSDRLTEAGELVEAEKKNGQPEGQPK